MPRWWVGGARFRPEQGACIRRFLLARKVEVCTRSKTVMMKPGIDFRGLCRGNSRFWATPKLPHSQPVFRPSWTEFGLVWQEDWVISGTMAGIRNETSAIVSHFPTSVPMSLRTGLAGALVSRNVHVGRIHAPVFCYSAAMLDPGEYLWNHRIQLK